MQPRFLKLSPLSTFLIILYLLLDPVDGSHTLESLGSHSWSTRIITCVIFRIWMTSFTGKQWIANSELRHI